MTFESFCNYMDKLKAFDDYADRLCEDGVMIYDTPSTSLSCALVEIMAEVLGDKNEWLEWWIYDTRYGTQCTTVMDGETEWNLITYRDIYDFITKEAKQWQTESE